MEEPQGSPKTWPPLGLPSGSVRALLTLLVLAVVATSLVRGDKLDILWTETLLIALAHYFTQRRFVALPADVIRRLQAEGVLDDERNPLYLPRHSIRTIILATFAGLACYLYREGRLVESLSLLGMVAAYLLGTIVRGITGLFNRRRTSRPWRIWADLRAVVVLVALVGAAVPQFLGHPDALSPEAQKIVLGLVLFYFGSR